MERSRVAIRSVIERFSNIETVVNARWSGHPETSNERQKRKIINIVKNYPTVSFSEVATVNEDFNKDVHPVTIHRVPLKTADIKVARRKPIITKTQRTSVLWYDREPL